MAPDLGPGGRDRLAGDVLLQVAAAFSAGAAVIHFAVLPEHLTESIVFASFFFVVGWFQLGWALIQMRTAPTAGDLVGILGNALVVGVWLASRTTGLPIGPDAGEPEPATTPDLLATIFELLIIQFCVLRLTAFGRVRIANRLVGRLPLVAAVLVVVTTGAVLLQEAGGHGR